MDTDQSNRIKLIATEMIQFLTNKVNSQQESVIILSTLVATFCDMFKFDIKEMQKAIEESYQQSIKATKS